MNWRSSGAANRVLRVLFLVLVGATLSPSRLVPASTSQAEAHQVLEAAECPVAFQNLSAQLSVADLEQVTLVAERAEVTEIQVPRPREGGFFAIKSHSPAGESMLGTYTAPKMPTTSYELSMGLGGIRWTTAATRVGDYEYRVPPGAYRLVLRYLAIGSGTPVQDEKQEVEVCLLISRPFVLTQELVILSTG